MALKTQTNSQSPIKQSTSRPKLDTSDFLRNRSNRKNQLKKLIPPNSLDLPQESTQVKIKELRPITLTEVERLVEINNLTLNGQAQKVDQAKSVLLATIARWYPTTYLGK